MSTIWITGLSGAGKSTLATEVVKRLKASNESVIMLDGDEIREVFDATSSNNISYERDKRLALAMQYTKLFRLPSNQGETVVIATISPNNVSLLSFNAKDLSYFRNDFVKKKQALQPIKPLSSFW